MAEGVPGSPDAPPGRYVIVTACVGLFVVYLALLGATLHPRVSEEYRAFYIDGSDPTWSGANAYAYRYGTTLHFGKHSRAPQDPRPHFAGGWYRMERDHARTDGSTASLHFTPATSTRSKICVQFSAGAVGNDGTRTVTVYANGRRIERLQLGDRQSHSVTVPPTVTRNVGPDSALNLTFHVERPVEGSAVSERRDTRQPGLRMRRLTLRISCP